VKWPPRLRVNLCQLLVDLGQVASKAELGEPHALGVAIAQIGQTSQCDESDFRMLILGRLVINVLAPHHAEVESGAADVPARLVVLLSARRPGCLCTELPAAARPDVPVIAPGSEYRLIVTARVLAWEILRISWLTILVIGFLLPEPRG